MNTVEVFTGRVLLSTFPSCKKAMNVVEVFTGNVLFSKFLGCKEAMNTFEVFAGNVLLSTSLGCKKDMHSSKSKKKWELNALISFLAEREGFEPTDPCRSTVFKTAAIDHSAISPRAKLHYFSFVQKNLFTVFITFTTAWYSICDIIYGEFSSQLFAFICMVNGSFCLIIPSIQLLIRALSILNRSSINSEIEPH